MNEPVSFSLHPGQLGLLTGPNGSGKTSILRALLGQGVGYEGNLRVLDSDARRVKPWRVIREGLRVIPQFPTLPVSLIVMEYVKVWRRYNPGCLVERERETDRHRVAKGELGRLFGIDTRVPISVLSTGQRRLLEIFLAFAAKPRVLLADEPLAGIAREFIPYVAEGIRGVRESSGAVLMVTHGSEASPWRGDWAVEVMPAKCRA